MRHDSTQLPLPEGPEFPDDAHAAARCNFPPSMLPAACSQPCYLLSGSCTCTPACYDKQYTLARVHAEQVRFRVRSS